jgi:CubicO group peptidase (beta-lactamase class C family)
MTKSITSVLVGCALADDYIDSLDTPISDSLPELKGGGYDGVSIRHVMQMRSGVDYQERYDFANPGTAASNHIAALVRNTARFADVARTLPRIHEPGELFQYKTIDTAVLGWLIERATGGSVAAYTASCLWEPLGAESDGYYIMDGLPGVGREFSGAGFNATLRDFARFGQMMLDGGIADGRRIVSEDWVQQSTGPSGETGEQRGGYGLQWWMVGQDNAYAAIGLQGQYIYIDPATRTVVVKLSYYPPGDNRADGEVQAFLEAASAWQFH